MSVAAIVIGRNEGDRLLRCLASLSGVADPIIYVDSGSEDGSVTVAETAGAVVVNLDMSHPFTAARARNAGLARLDEICVRPEFVQLVDGDCEIREGWIPAAEQFLEENPDVAFVTGRLRERCPEASLWNRLADAEWNTPIGEVHAVGGIAMLRRQALAEEKGFRADLIAGEEPELCLRLRRRGWRIYRLDAEMAWHDIAMTRFSQWWKRCRRGGHAFAEGAFLHRAGPERYRRREVLRALFWGLGVPGLALLGMFFTPWALGILLLWPLQMQRLHLRGMSTPRAVFLVLGMLPEAQGVFEFHLSRIMGRQRGIIEYK